VVMTNFKSVTVRVGLLYN